MIFVLIIILLLHLFLLLHSQFTAWPEMLSYPYLLMNGFNLYSDYIIPYPPGLTFFLAFVYKFFGVSPEILKYLTWFLILVIDVPLFYTLRKISNNTKVITIFLIAFVFLQVLLDGNMLWFELGYLLPVLLAFINFNNWLNKKELKYLVLSSIFLTLGIFIKQTVLFYIIGLGVFYFFTRRKFLLSEIFQIALIPLIVSGAFFLYLISTNSLIDFWNWNFYYPVFVWSKFPGYGGFHLSSKDLIVTLILFVPVIFILNKSRFKEKRVILTLIFIGASLLAIYPRLVFFHLQPTLVFLIILYLQIFTYLKGSTKKIFSIVIFVSFIISIFALTKNFPFFGSIRFYDENDKKVSQVIDSYAQGNKIFLIGFYSSYYIYSNTLPVKPWVDNFGWYFEITEVQEKLIEGLKKDEVGYIFIKNPEPGPWYEIGVYQPKKVVDFIHQNYHFKKINGDIEIWEKN